MVKTKEISATQIMLPSRTMTAVDSCLLSKCEVQMADKLYIVRKLLHTYGPSHLMTIHVNELYIISRRLIFVLVWLVSANCYVNAYCLKCLMFIHHDLLQNKLSTAYL